MTDTPYDDFLRTLGLSERPTRSQSVVRDEPSRSANEVRLRFRLDASLS